MKRLFLLMAVLTASCSFQHPLPENWKLPAPGEGEQCPDISGQYLDRADKANQRATVYLISQWKGEFHALTTPPEDWKGEHQVLIRGESKDQLEVLYLTDTGVILSSHILRRESGDFSCKDGWMITREKIWNAPLPTTIIRSFAKTDDFLIEKVEGSTFNVLGFPWYAEGTYWFRYFRIDSKVDGSRSH